MAKIVIVHGMRMARYSKAGLHKRWSADIRNGLLADPWSQAHPELLPGKDDVEVVFWADLFRGPAVDRGETSKGVTDLLLGAYYAALRGSVRLADFLSLWDAQGKPRGPIARLVNGMVYQSAAYMRNGPVPRPDPAFEPGAFFQIQGRFQAALKGDTRVVIGHSLGSVIAYEGLCLNAHAHRVSTFITVGSPIATPRLILRPLRERLERLINTPTAAAPPWPSVARWTNFFAPADVWSVPVRRLAPIFDPRIVDVQVKHGNPHRAVETHKLTTYLRHRALLDEIARGLGLGPDKGHSRKAA